MDPQDPNTPKQPDIDTSNPFDQFYDDQEETSTAEVDIPADIQSTINELAPQVPTEPALDTSTPIPEPVPQAQPDVMSDPLPTEANYTDSPVPELATDPPPAAAPEPRTAQNNYVATTQIKINGTKIVVGLFLFLLMTAVGVIGVMAATGNLNDVPFVAPITRQIQKLPFFSKSPEYVIEQAMAATVTIDSYHYDLSASVKIASQQFGVGGGDAQFDLAATGDATFTSEGTPDKVQGNISFGSALEGYNGTAALDYVFADEMVYFKTGDITGTFASFASSLPPVDIWHSLDMSPLDTQARTMLETTITPTVADEQMYAKIKEMATQLFESERFQDEMTLVGVETMSDETKAHHVKIVPSVDTLMEIFTALAEHENQLTDPEDLAVLRDSLNNLRSFTIDVWIDEDNFLVRKFQMVGSYAYDSSEFIPSLPMVFNPDGPLVAGVSKVLAESEVQQDTIDFSIVTELSNINKTPVITVPTEHTSMEDYLSAAFGPMLEFDDSFTPSFEDIVVRNSNIKSTVGYTGMAFEEYFAKNGMYPSSIADLVTDGQLFKAPTPPLERAESSCAVTTEYAYGKSTDEAAVWADLEPCAGDETQEWYVYWTACGKTTTITGPQPNEMDIAIGKGC